MSNNKVVDIVAIVLDIVIVVLAALVLVKIANQPKTTEPTCSDGIYTIRDGNKLETIYLQAEDTCRLENNNETTK